MVWLSAIPQGHAAPRKDWGIKYTLPDIADGADLIGHLSEIGNCKQIASDNGIPIYVGLGHVDIRAYQQNMGFELTPWEVKTLHKMSKEYALVYCTAFDPKTPAPYEIETPQDRAKRIQDEIFR